LLALVAGAAFGLWQRNVWAGLWLAAISILSLLAARLAGATPPVSPEVKRWLEEHRK
jgi:hypothetical protein